MRFMQGVLWVGVVMFVSSLVLPVLPHLVTGWDEASGWRTGFDLHLAYFFGLIWEPFKIYETVQEYSPHGLIDEPLQNMRYDVLQDYLWRTVPRYLQTLSVIFSSIIVILSIALFRRFAVPTTQVTLLRVTLALTLWGTAYFFAVELFESARTYVGGQLHLGMGAYLWVCSYILIGFSLLFTKRLA